MMIEYRSQVRSLNSEPMSFSTLASAEGLQKRLMTSGALQSNGYFFLDNRDTDR